jgi:hypothetical protein
VRAVAAPQHWVVLEGLHNQRPQGYMSEPLKW